MSDCLTASDKNPYPPLRGREYSDSALLALGTRSFGALLVAALLPLNSCLNPSPPEDVLKRQPRPFEVRFSTFEHVPCDGKQNEVEGFPATRLTRCNGTPQPGTRRFRELDRLGLALSTGDDNGRDEHLTGLYSLLWADDVEQLDTVRRAWRELLSFGPESPGLYSDFAALSLVQARAHDSGWPTIEALGLLQKARNANPHHLPTLYNWALALEDIGLHWSAFDAWKEYLDIETDEVLRREAQEHLLSLNLDQRAQRWSEARALLKRSAQEKDELRFRETARLHRQQLFEDFLENGLRDWARFLSETDHRSDARLTYLRYTVRAFESWGLATFPALETVSNRSTTNAAQSLKELHWGVQKYRQHEYESARKSLLQAARSLDDIEPSLALWAQFYATVSLYQRDSMAGREALLALRARISDGQNLLKAYTERVLGLAYNQQREYDRALVHFDNEIAFLQRAGFGFAEAKARSAIAVSLEQLGRLDEALAYRLLGLQFAVDHGQSRVHYNKVFNVGDHLSRMGPSEVERLFFHEAMRIADSWGDVVAKVESRGRLSRTADEPVAARLVEQTVPLLGAIEDPELSAILSADLSLVSATRELDADSETTRKRLRSAAKTFLRLGDRKQWVAAQVMLGSVEIAAGNRDRARGILVQSQKEIEQAESPSGASGRSVSAAAERLYEGLLELSLTGDAQLALSYAERLHCASRNRICALPERYAEVLDRSETEALVYQEVGRQLVGWHIANGEVTFRRLGDVPGPTSPKHLAEDRSKADEFFNLLIAPFQVSLGKTVLVVPSPSTVAVPFNVLLGNRNQPHEHRLVVYANSLSQALRSRPHRDEGLGPERVLIAAPFSQVGGRRRPHLVHSSAEIAQVGSSFPADTTLEGVQATIPKFLATLPDSTIVHYAGHTAVDAVMPTRSYLYFSGANGFERLSTSDLGNLALQSVELFVMASCAASVEGPKAHRARFGLAQAILDSGAGCVLAAMWDVSDRETSILMADFYQRLQRGLKPVRALADAQYAAAQQGVRDWAAWRLIGQCSLATEGKESS